MIFFIFNRICVKLFIILPSEKAEEGTVMAGTGRKYSEKKSAVAASRSSLRRVATREKENSFISSTPAVGGPVSKFQ